MLALISRYRINVICVVEYNNAVHNKWTWTFYLKSHVIWKKVKLNTEMQKSYNIFQSKTSFIVFEYTKSLQKW